MGPNTAGCGRRQGSALRFARWRGANAALTAVLAGQDNPRIRAKAKRKIGLLGTDHQKERATYTKSRTLPDDFVLRKPPTSTNSNRVQQAACNRFNINHLETTDFNKFQ
jgi:hypothetical protein